jgi:type I restriction enzyme S subunit
MSEIRKLLSELCPNGVPYLSLREVAAIGTGSSNRNESTGEGIYPFYVRSKEVRRIDSYEFDETAVVIPGEGGVGDIFHYVEGKYALHQRAYRIAFHDVRVVPKFAYYYLKVDFKVFIKAKAVDGTVTSIRKPMIEAFSIPVPPIPVQQKIVEILDTFTELEAQLEKELEARKSQYQYCRSKLLSFNNTEADEILWIPLGDVLRKLNSYVAIEKSEYQESGSFPVINQAQQLVAGFSDREDLALQSGEYIVFGDHTRCIKYLNERFIAGESGTLVFIATQDCRTKYLYYAFKNLDIQSRGYSRHWSVVKDMKIPIPSLELQDKMIGMLDKFSELTGEISGGLPSEISALQKQNEYYLNKLMTFKELEIS